MQLSQLRTFVAIAREQNLTRAAEALHLSQSAISNQLKCLEEQLGVHLFVRSTRGMTLSEPGRILLSHAREVIAATENMQRSAETLSRGVTASITIGLNTDPTFLRISAINQRLALLHTDLNVIFHTSETANTAQRLRTGQIDLGFFYGPLQEPDIAHLPITQVRICVAIPSRLVSDAQPLNWTDLAALPWVWVDDKFPFYRVLAEKMGGITSLPSDIVTAANEQIVRELVIAGQGVALMREDEARPLAQEGSVMLWDQGWGTVPLSLGWLRERSGERPIEAARDAIGHIWDHRPADSDGSLSDKVWA